MVVADVRAIALTVKDCLRPGGTPDRRHQIWQLPQIEKPTRKSAIRHFSIDFCLAFG